MTTRLRFLPAAAVLLAGCDAARERPASPLDVPAVSIQVTVLRPADGSTVTADDLVSPGLRTDIQALRLRSHGSLRVLAWADGIGTFHDSTFPLLGPDPLVHATVQLDETVSRPSRIWIGALLHDPGGALLAADTAMVWIQG